MIAAEIIRKKRDGGELADAEIAAFIAGLTGGDISDAQAAAFAMATWFRGMSAAETVALTLAMRDSGTVLTWPETDRPVADKHSTGGIGDNVSLMLAPIAAACGLAVPMISGRGLGHTGGTLDKLETIPGYDIKPSSLLFRQAVERAGCAIVGQTADLAPADRRLYAIRDLTATVDSVPLITASILSKKLAAGLQSLVLDVKIGTGAFMTDRAEAERLARTLVSVANGAGVRTTALLTDMNEPLADAVGNGLEIRHCLDFLKGNKSGTRIETVVLACAGQMLLASGIALDARSGEAMARAALESGRALEHFALMVEALSGPTDFTDHPDRYLSPAPVVLPIPAPRSGYLATCNARAIGMELIVLGGGRLKVDDVIDGRVGFDRLLPLGSPVHCGDPIGFVLARTTPDAERAAARVTDCYGILEEPPLATAVVLETISG